MPAIITVASLRTVLGVSVSLYSNDYLESIIDSAEQVILPLLTANQNSVAAVYLQNNVAYYITQKPNTFVAGQSVVVTGCVPSTFNGTQTVTSNFYDPFPYLPFAYPAPYFYFTAAITNNDITFRPVIPGGVVYLSGADAATLYANTDAVEQAVTIVSVEIFQSVVAPGGQIEGVDFQPSPFRMGRSLQNRVIGLLGNYVDVSTMAMQMPTPTSIATNIRGTLATALASVAASVYSTVPEAVIPPACVIVPDAPYLETTTIGKSTVRVKVNLVVSAAVAYNNNAGALDNLEQLVISIMQAMPTGYVVGDVQQPTIQSVGASNILVADLAVSTYYTQETI